MGKRSGLPVKDRREAVLSLLRREEPGTVIARRYGVSEASLYRWRDEFLAAGEAALAGGTRLKWHLHSRSTNCWGQKTYRVERSGHWRADGRQPDF